MELLKATPGYSFSERLSNREWQIFLLCYECPHSKWWNIEVLNKLTGSRKIIHHTHSYRHHWEMFYNVSERLIIRPMLMAQAQTN